MKGVLAAAVIAFALAACGFGGGTRQVPHRTPVAERLAVQRLHSGAHVFIRVFKADNLLELWLLDGDRYRLFETYPICRWSGRLGPKLHEGDGQAPEGFYAIAPSQMNPRSLYHRAFNLGFPTNAYDRANGRSGSNLMVHGACSSAGCYAMTDAQIDEIFDLMQAALAQGQAAVAVDVLPFRPTKAALSAHASDAWSPFWQTLAKGESVFERTGRPAAVFACGKSYDFTGGRGCLRIRQAG